MKSVLVIIADGSEELEAVTVINLLRRAGISVTVASISNMQIKGARGTNIVADILLKDCIEDTWDIIIDIRNTVKVENLNVHLLIKTVNMLKIT